MILRVRVHGVNEVTSYMDQEDWATLDLKSKDGNTTVELFLEKGDPIEEMIEVLTKIKEHTGV